MFVYPLDWRGGGPPCTTPNVARAFLHSKRDTPCGARVRHLREISPPVRSSTSARLFRDKQGKLTIRLSASDALFLFRVLPHHVSTEKFTSFNLIDPSNMADRAGLLNVFIAAVPLLSPALSATLFTEALQYTREDAVGRSTTQSSAMHPQ